MATINAIAATEIRFPMAPASVLKNANRDKIPNKNVVKRVILPDGACARFAFWRSVLGQESPLSKDQRFPIICFKSIDCTDDNRVVSAIVMCRKTAFKPREASV